MKIYIVLLACIIFLVGCAEIEPPSPEKLITPWNVMISIRTGNTKELVISKWGEPDKKNQIGVDEFGTIKEEWVYYGKYPMAPIDDQYLSKNRYLYFEGNILVRQEVRPLSETQGK